MYDYGARNYDPALGRWMSIDPLAEQTDEIYSYVWNNPVLMIDPDGRSGESTHTDKFGNVLKNVDDGDNGVYVHENAKSEADVDKTYSSENTSAGGEKIGELGGVIDVNKIYSNTLTKNMDESKSIWNPFTFKKNVTDFGKWDLKNNKNTIFGLGNDGKTQFSFEGNLMVSQDIGNHHFGAVALAYGLFSESFILQQAGQNQIDKGGSKPEWQIYKTESVPTFTKSDRLIWTEKRTMLPPYGDDPRDQKWIKAGFNYFKKNR